MADINVERKRRSVWPLLLALLLIAAIAVAAWQYLASQNDAGVSETTPAAEVQSTPDAGNTAPAPGTTTAPPPTTSGY